MASPIFNALFRGYTSRSILNGIARRSPKYASAIRKAEVAGYAAHSILKSIVGNKSDDDEEYLTEHERTQKRDKDRHKRLAIQAASALGTAGAVAGGLYSIFNQKTPQQIQSISQRQPPQITGGPTSPSNPPGSPPPSPIPAAPIQLGHNPQKPPAPVSPQKQSLLNKFSNLPDEKPVPQEAKGLPPGTVESNFPQMQLFVRKSLQNGKSPEEIYDRMRDSVFYRGLVEKFEAEEGVPFLEKIQEMGSGVQKQTPKMPETTQIVPEVPKSLPIESIKQEEPISMETKDPEPIKKGSQVIMPDGRIGSVFHERGNKGVVESDGKKYKADLGELEHIPREWENIQVDLSKVPEAERSSNLEWVAGDPKQIVIRFWGHKPMLYRYFAKNGQEIDPQILETISKETDAPVTSGFKFAGAWSPSGKSRGSAFHHRLKLMSQSIDDPDDPEKPFLFQRIPLVFEHGYLTAVRKSLQIAEKKFNDHFYPSKRKRPGNS